MLEGAVVIWILFGIISMVAAQKKGRSGCGWFLLGMLLGPFGFILALLSDPIEEPQKPQPQNTQNGASPYYLLGPENKLIDVTPSRPTIQKPNETITKTFDYTDKVVFEWPVELISGQIISLNDSKDEAKATFIVANASSKGIKYMEWHIRCYDMLKKAIPVEQPVVIRSELSLRVRGNVKIEQTGFLPQDTRYFLPYLRAVVFEDDEIIEYPEGLMEIDASGKSEIEQVEDVEYYCIVAFQQRNNPIEEPRVLFASHPSGVWTCAYCGTRNKAGEETCRCCAATVEGQSEYSKAALETFSLVWKDEQEQKAKQKKLSMRGKNKKDETLMSSFFLRKKRRARRRKTDEPNEGKQFLNMAYRLC